MPASLHKITYTLERSSRTNIGFMYKSIRVPLIETDLAILAYHLEKQITCFQPAGCYLTTLEYVAFDHLSRVFRAILNNESGSLKREEESEAEIRPLHRPGESCKKGDRT